MRPAQVPDPHLVVGGSLRQYAYLPAATSIDAQVVA